MVKRFVILRRRPGMAVEEFRKYWRDTHGPLIARLPGLRRYIQYHVASEEADGTVAPIDGIAELWFDSPDAQRRAYETPEYQAVVDDEPNLFEMNTHSVHPVMTEDTVVVVDV